MFSLARHRYFSAALVWGAALAFVAALTSEAHAQSRPQDIELVKALRGGGHVILMRHFQADPDGFDRNPRDFKNVRQQQQLTETGRATARVVGNWFKVIGVPVAEVVSSRFFRCTQSASLAGFGPVRMSDDVTEGSLIESPNENRRRAKALRALLGGPLPIRNNRVIVTHRISIQNALGKEWFEVKEGEASIFRTEGASYTLVARVQADEWSRIAQAARELDQPRAPAVVPPAPPIPAPAPPNATNGTAMPIAPPVNGKKP
jgi:broad specificity phosphatase PhoE